MDITFHGAAREVTGSCLLVECAGRRVLLDCGLIQGSPAEEARNRRAFPFNPRALDAVVLSHAHLDHSGRLPLLVKHGYRGPIYTHRATRDLCRIMLLDAAALSEKDAELETRKRRRRAQPPVEPLYTRAEAEAAVRQIRALDYDSEQDILPGMRLRLRLRDAGHILGSAIVELWLTENRARRKLVFSGDLGHRGAPILRNPETVREADLVILESTYGDRNHRSWEATWQELGEIFREAAHHAGNVLIPAFAIGRTQELLYVLKQHWRAWELDRWTIFLDSPMAIDATEVHARHWKLFDTEAGSEHRRNGNPFALPNLHFSRTAAQSMAINRIQSGALIIAGSGMCNGGRIRHHLKHNLWREQCHVIFTGFQARGTLGRSLVDGTSQVRLWGETIRVAAQIHTIGGLSAHADQAGLLEWYRGFGRPRPTVALVHGEPPAMETLAEKLKALRAPVMLPTPGLRLDLTDLPR
ncbi:MAG: MBL fold metallo-hydrolase [Candidatus Muproteobacteria bacterium RBG_16_64_11]|uniref:MBL fold metallo-hydrolase n=1 Tax=Candidatus Muproteobacteria bacterium RBG_16_64_11 TaxID=1817758 RepID=A0A1F6T9G3_9PROT|nr:MAG: MBL fold metallo-hydrolase [Candidatus Muproteobacteria bacterium RBG_16_64_11]